jgi:hypothetical protein
MSAGPSTSTHSSSYNADPPREGAVSSTQLSSTFSAGLKAASRCPDSNQPLPLAPPTQSSRTSGPSVIDATLSTTLQPQIPSPASDPALSEEPRNRLLDEYVPETAQYPQKILNRDCFPTFYFQRRKRSPGVGEVHSPGREHLLSPHERTAADSRRRHSAAHQGMPRTAVFSDHIHSEGAKSARRLAERLRDRRGEHGSRGPRGVLLCLAKSEASHQLRILMHMRP